MAVTRRKLRWTVSRYPRSSTILEACPSLSGVLIAGRLNSGQITDYPAHTGWITVKHDCRVFGFVYGFFCSSRFL